MTSVQDFRNNNYYLALDNYYRELEKNNTDQEFQFTKTPRPLDPEVFRANDEIVTPGDRVRSRLLSLVTFVASHSLLAYVIYRNPAPFRTIFSNVGKIGVMAAFPLINKLPLLFDAKAPKKPSLAVKLKDALEMEAAFKNPYSGLTGAIASQVILLGVASLIHRYRFFGASFTSPFVVLSCNLIGTAIGETALAIISIAARRFKTA